MFGFDLAKMVIFGVVALLVVGPKELPAALRAAGRVLTQVRRARNEIRTAADRLMRDASLDDEITNLRDTVRANLALDPATAMRGNLPGADPARTPPQAEALEYASPAMQAYLAPPAEAETGCRQAEHGGA